MRIAITGAAGFVGRHLARRLAGRHAVCAVIRPEHDAAPLWALGAQVARADVRDADALTRAVAGCDAVIHLATLTTRRHAPARAYYDVNVGGTRAVVEAVRVANVGNLVLGSTLGVYGLASVGEAPRPNTPYRRSKWEAECIALGGRVAATVVRIPATLGPGAVSWLGWVRDIAAGRFWLPGDGRARKTLADVSDVVEGLALAVEVGRAGATYDLAGPGPVAVGDLADLWAEGVGAEVERGAVPTWALRTLARVGDLADRAVRRSVPKAHAAEFFTADTWRPCDDARRVLGYAPRVTVEEAVARTLAEYRAAGQLSAPSLSAPAIR